MLLCTCAHAADPKRRTTKDERPVILVTTVDIGDGKSDKIEIRRGDDPEDAARAFCMRHNLPASITTPLTAHILDNLKRASKTPDSKVRSALTHLRRQARRRRRSVRAGT